jgi:hypothetical protein
VLAAVVVAAMETLVAQVQVVEAEEVGKGDSTPTLGLSIKAVVVAVPTETHILVRLVAALALLFCGLLAHPLSLLALV